MIDNVFFCAGDERTLLSALGPTLKSAERSHISELAAKGLPPITSVPALSVMTGLHPGLIISILREPNRHYRIFRIPKGKSSRQIEAPRVILKTMQKWLSIHLQNCHKPTDNVFGFVAGRSHVDAAKQHRFARWVFSFDIENFFPSTTNRRIEAAFRRLGYGDYETKEILVPLSSYEGRLSQGAPISPVLSNICLDTVDRNFGKFATENGLIYTRYADDLTFSGTEAPPAHIEGIVRSFLSATPWKINEKKLQLQIHPSRLKVHGLIVGDGNIKITKGYKNQIRMYRYLEQKFSANLSNRSQIIGHLGYADFVARKGSLDG